MDVFLAALAGAFGAGGLILVGWIIVRFIIPLLERTFSGYLGVKKTIDVDRDRVVTGLRDEIKDLERKLQRERADRKEENDRNQKLLKVAHAEIIELRDQISDLEGFIDRFLDSRGTNRGKIERGEDEWPK